MSPRAVQYICPSAQGTEEGGKDNEMQESGEELTKLPKKQF